MQDFFCTDPDKMHYPQLAERTKYFKKEKEGVVTMSKILENMRREVIERVARETTKNNARETASKLLRSLGLSYEQVAECVNLSLSEVKELAKTLGV